MKRGVAIPLGIGLAAAGLSVAYATYDARRALVAWIAAFAFVVATVLATAILVMIFHVTGARWWRVLRRVFIAVLGTAPLLPIFFLPIAASLDLVYPWVSPPEDVPRHVERALEHQRAWNHPQVFLSRALVYLATWTVFAVLLRRADAASLKEPSPANTRREQTISAVGLPLVSFTLTFAAFDWFMSLEPAWVSNIFGLYVFASGLVSALAVVALASWLTTRRGLTSGAGPDHFHAVGRLTLMAVILWTYIAFFQLLLVWIANLPVQVSFYVVRSRGAWMGVGALLLIGRFIVPFIALLSRSLKRSPSFLAAAGVWLVATSALDFEWLVVPAGGHAPSFADVAPFVCLSALTWAYGAHLVDVRGRAPAEHPEAVVDPALEDAMRYRSP